MFIPSKKLIGLRVETVSGDFLGHIKEFEVDSENNIAVNFYIRPSGIVKGLVSQELKITKTQIVSLDNIKMVVDDLSKENKEKNEGYKNKFVVEGSVISASTIE